MVRNRVQVWPLIRSAGCWSSRIRPPARIGVDRHITFVRKAAATNSSVEPNELCAILLIYLTGKMALGVYGMGLYHQVINQHPFRSLPPHINYNMSRTSNILLITCCVVAVAAAFIAAVQSAGTRAMRDIGKDTYLRLPIFTSDGGTFINPMEYLP